jgi:hypothetical protein
MQIENVSWQGDKKPTLIMKDSSSMMYKCFSLNGDLDYELLDTKFLSKRKIKFSLYLLH